MVFLGDLLKIVVVFFDLICLCSAHCVICGFGVCVGELDLICVWDRIDNFCG